MNAQQRGLLISDIYNYMNRQIGKDLIDELLLDYHDLLLEFRNVYDGDFGNLLHGNIDLFGLLTFDIVYIDRVNGYRVNMYFGGIHVITFQTDVGDFMELLEVMDQYFVERRSRYDFFINW